MIKALLIIFIGLPLYHVGAWPGDTGLETWRSYGQTPTEQMAESGLNTYYPSACPYIDTCLYWTFHNNQIEGGGFRPSGPYSTFIYVRMFNDYIGGNTVRFNPGLNVETPDYITHAPSTSGDWIILGSGHFPAYTVFTLKIYFNDREGIQQVLRDAIANGTEQFKTSSWCDIRTNYEIIGFEDPVEHEGEWYSNAIYNIIYTTNIIPNGTIYWVEYHLGDGVYRKIYNEGGNNQYQPIPPEYADLPDSYIPEFTPYGDNPTLSFIARPSKYTADFSDIKVEYYNVLWSTNLVEGAWGLEERIKVYGDKLIVVPLNIIESDQQCFYRISEFSGIYKIVNPD